MTHRALITTIHTLAWMILAVAVACPAEAWADLPVVVVFDRDADGCDEEFDRTLIDELLLRSTAELVDARGSDEGPAAWKLVLHAGDARQCHVRLEGGAETTTFAVDVDADRVVIASVANRLAWILDPRTPASRSEPQPKSEPEPGPDAGDAASDSAPDDATSVDISNEASTRPNPTERRRPFRIDATGGALWIPTANTALPLAVASMRWKPWARFAVGLSGRVPLGVARATIARTEFTYRPWAFELTAAYVQPFGDGWSLTLGAGGRRALAQVSVLETETGARSDAVPEGTPARVTSGSDTPTTNALSPWAAILSAGVSRELIPLLAVRLDLAGAASLTDREVRDDRRTLLDLGRYDFDALLGLELRF